MTEKELKAIENELQKRGYRKWTVCLTSEESYGWFKTFGSEGDDYQIEFRVWDYTKYHDPYGEPYGFDVWMSPKNGYNNSCECGWEPIADIGTFERMAAEFNQMVRRFVNLEKE